MNNEQCLIDLLHCTVRNILINQSVSDPYLSIIKAVYPSSLFSEVKTKPINNHYLQSICNYIYDINNEQVNYSSCYSASIVVQIIAMAHGVSSEIVIGIKKQDMKVLGHAWVEVNTRGGLFVANPGYINIKDFKPIRKLNPNNVLHNWMEGKCASGQCY